MMQIPQCMGGWCKQRTVCQHYYADRVRGVEPIQRMCPRGEDRPLLLVAVRNRRQEPAEVAV